MRIAFIADIHSNLEALDAVLTEIDRERVDQIYCLGDLVGYGANPQACIEIIRARGIATVAGNHDRAVCGLLETTYFNEEATQSVLWTRRAISEEQYDYLCALPLTLHQGPISLAHGSLADPPAFGYVISGEEAYACFQAHSRRFAIVGHSHVPITFLLDDEGVAATVDPEFLVPQGARAIINVGAVGQPRDGIPQAAYLLFDADSGSVSVRRVAYDVERAGQKILTAGLPTFNAYRLLAGR